MGGRFWRATECFPNAPGCLWDIVREIIFCPNMNIFARNRNIFHHVEWLRRSISRLRIPRGVMLQGTHVVYLAVVLKYLCSKSIYFFAYKRKIISEITFNSENFAVQTNLPPHTYYSIILCQK